MKGYKHLTEFDRNKIARMRKEGATMREIGAALHVSAATVCREIKRGTIHLHERGLYRSDRVHTGAVTSPATGPTWRPRAAP